MSKPKRIAQPGKRHRRDNGPSALEVVTVPPPDPASIGQLTLHTDSILSGGPASLIATNKRAKILAEECGEVFGEDFKLQWTFETKWIQDLKATHRGRVRADYSMSWRPMFLATVALTYSPMIAYKAADVAPATVIVQRKEDPDFDAQVIAAQAHCIELLHSVTMRRALEGDIEPVYWQGIRVGHIRKFDGRLQVELLRAHMPDKFKTPGNKVTVNTGDVLNVLQVDDHTRNALQAMRAESLKRIAEKRANAIEVGTVPPAGVPPTP